MNRALNVLRIDYNTNKSYVFLAMWMLQSGHRLQEINCFAKKGFLPILQTFEKFFIDESDIFWMAKKFYDNILKFEAEIPKLVERSHSLLEKEEGPYYKILKEKGILEKIPLAKWFDCCFAGILNENALAK